MPSDLILLDGVAWKGEPVVGERAQALLAVLATAGGRVVRAERLVEGIWGERALADPAKSLQVVVSRTRSACGPDVVVREGDGYRLGIAAERVDGCRLEALAAAARRAVATDPEAARTAAQGAIGVANGIVAPPEDEDGPLAALRREAAGHARDARVVLARVRARTGDAEDVLPDLEAAHAADPGDEALLADLLLGEAAVRGPAVALDRFERHRRALLERTGSAPGEALQRIQRDLLARDRPVREGVRYDATELLGRDGDVRRLRALLTSSRVVSILGPGGLGKTRLAHVLARDAAQPVVHVVELVGVTSPDDVVGELGSVLGVRDSVSGRRTLTPEQRADVRGRVAEHLGRAPSLLVLDNCEHVVEAVAPLVAFLVSATADLRVLTTTRAPLAIAAEHVYALDQLSTADATELFRRRAVAARPGVRLDDAVVRRIAERLDGLPLALELAAARVRSMSVEDVDRRLEDRFALLRGGDRGAPDRHRTLTAVIDWSWNLLDEPERRGLRRLSTFHDGFTLEAAEAVLGSDAIDVVGRLADQSLVTVRESGAGVRHRMLETVREFGRLRLAEGGETADAERAHRAWATGYATRHGERLFGPTQFDAIDALAEEENNLSDALRRALDEPDRSAVAHLLAALAGFWSIRGEHARIIVLTSSVAAALDGWDPPAEDRQAARGAVIVTLTNAMMTIDEAAAPLRDLLERVGIDEGGDPQLAASLRVMAEYAPVRAEGFTERLERLCDDPDRHTARIALQWASHTRENAGDTATARRFAVRSLTFVRPEDGPWTAAILHTQIAQMAGALGDHASCARHIDAALPVLERLGARDDLLQCRTLRAVAAVVAGDLAAAEADLAAIDALDDLDAVFLGRAMTGMARAELLLARGDVPGGLAVYRGIDRRMQAMRIPGLEASDHEPWMIVGVATALAATARHARPGDDGHAPALARLCRDRALGALRSGELFLDFPATGLALFGLGAWGTWHGALPAEAATGLLVLADRFAYSRSMPTMAWAPAAAAAEARGPGLLADWEGRLGDRRGTDVRQDAERLLADLAL